MVGTHDALLTAAAHGLKNSLTAIIMRADRSSCIGVGWKSGNDGRMGIDRSAWDRLTNHTAAASRLQVQANTSRCGTASMTR
jgi:hypothetical protein